MDALSAPAPIAAGGNGTDAARIDKVARQFEALFLRQMIGSMRSAALADGAFDSSATDQFRDMADARTADAMADGGGFGLAALLRRQFEAKAAPAQASAAPVVKQSE